jgi:hypothetical protein
MPAPGISNFWRISLIKRRYVCDKHIRFPDMNYDSSVGVVTTLRARIMRNRASILGRGKIYVGFEAFTAVIMIVLPPEYNAV